MELSVLLPQKIPDSWKKEEHLQWFIQACGYAGTQTRAIPVLAQSSPDDLFYFLKSVLCELCLWDYEKNQPVDAEALRVALHDAINRPKGVVPDSALDFYEPSRF